MNKQQHLVSTALSLFYQKGINTIGINEIISVSGVAKKTLYHHFANKEALILATLALRHQRFITWLKAQLAAADTDQAVIEHLFAGLNRWFNDNDPLLGSFRGCFFINTAAEFSDLSCEINRYCAEHKAKVREVIAAKLSSERPQLLDAICIMKEGAIISAYMNGNASQICQQCVHTLTAFAQQNR